MAVQETLAVSQTQASNRTSMSALLELIGQRQRYFVTSHARPDGDALGSALGMMYLLEAMGKQVVVGFSDPIPAVYRWMPGIERIHGGLCAGPDAAIVLECDRVERTGFDAGAFAAMQAGLTVNIDHHLSGRPFADFNWIDPEACAVGAMVYDLAVASGVKITPEMATCLYTAVLTDTGSFTYPSTVAGTFALAQHLVESGADASAIAKQVYLSNPEGKVRALGAALSTMKIENGVAWAWITEEQMKRAGAVVEDCEGIVNSLSGIADVEVAIFLRELPPGDQFRLSLRSRGKIDVAEVAGRFGGGGHRNASGCTLEGPLDLAIGRMLEELGREVW
jgi:phosphoesterase RecJ-like protein